MRMILRCPRQSGYVLFPVSCIDDIEVSERLYTIENHRVILDGAENIVRHDVGVLLATPGSGYRLPTPGEQEQT